MRAPLRAFLILVVTVAGMLVPVDRASAQLGSLISPGPLARPHASLEGVANCAKCHEQGRRVTAQKCLACHAPIAQRIARKSGVHKDVTNDCVACHAEHAGVDGQLRPFDQASFDHATTGFPLTGKHALGARQCAACHKGRSFLDASSACASCHADVHKGALGANCATCHSTQAAFKGSATQFDHAKAAFALTGAHKTVACASCHAGSLYKGVKFASCADCHKDPHRPAMGASCTSCHTTDGWRTKSVNHARTDFPLVGQHAKVECASCHKQPATKVTLRSDTCASCHEDVHRGTFQQDCKVCHSENGWTNGRFDHNTTTFTLSGRHTGLACEKCHRQGAGSSPARSSPAVAASRPVAPARVVDFRGLKSSCVSCHEDVHQAELGASCETCHSAESFNVRSYPHRQPATFFAGQHAALTCAQCHVSPAPTRPIRTGAAPLAVRFTAATRGCVSCHKDVHLGQLDAKCEACHSIDAARFAVSINHSGTAFPLEGKHADVACRGCHKPETAAFPAGTGTAVRLKGLSTTCAACHADVHLGQLGSGCESCHTATTFRVASYKHRSRAVLALMTGAHARAACADCHKSSTGTFPAGKGTAVRFVTGTTCVSCHNDVHRGALGTNCGNCHRP